MNKTRTDELKEYIYPTIHDSDIQELEKLNPNQILPIGDERIIEIDVTNKADFLKLAKTLPKPSQWIGIGYILCKAYHNRSISSKWQTIYYIISGETMFYYSNEIEIGKCPVCSEKLYLYDKGNITCSGLSHREDVQKNHFSLPSRWEFDADCVSAAKKLLIETFEENDKGEIAIRTPTNLVHYAVAILRKLQVKFIHVKAIAAQIEFEILIDLGKEGINLANIRVA